MSVLPHGFHLRQVHTNQDHRLGTLTAEPEMFQPLATCLRRENELINLAIPQVVEFPPAVGIGATTDHHIPRSILAKQVDSSPLRELVSNAVSRISPILSELASRI